MVGLEGIEPPTNGLGNRCSILLSYRPMICNEQHSESYEFSACVREAKHSITSHEMCIAHS
jgi:hypothetical protein